MGEGKIQPDWFPFFSCIYLVWGSYLLGYPQFGVWRLLLRVFRWLCTVRMEPCPLTCKTHVQPLSYFPGLSFVLLEHHFFFLPILIEVPIFAIQLILLFMDTSFQHHTLHQRECPFPSTRVPKRFPTASHHVSSILWTKSSFVINLTMLLPGYISFFF